MKLNILWINYSISLKLIVSYKLGLELTVICIIDNSVDYSIFFQKIVQKKKPIIIKFTELQTSNSFLKKQTFT